MRSGQRKRGEWSQPEVEGVPQRSKRHQTGAKTTMFNSNSSLAERHIIKAATYLSRTYKQQWQEDLFARPYKKRDHYTEVRFII
jgi:hypothetical protein